MHKLAPPRAAIAAAARRRDTLAGWLGNYILPFGLFVLLTGMFWAGDRTVYHRLFYTLLAVPAFIAVIVRPALLRDVAHSPVALPFLAFSGFTLLSILWSGTDTAATSLLKRPLYVALLLVATIATQQLAPARIRQVLVAATATAVIAGLVSLALFAHEGGANRLTGYGALYNPLLSSHVFGFFLAVSIAAWIEQRQAFPLPSVVATGVLAMVILATGSRTPLIATAAAVIWLAALSGGKRAIVAVTALVGIGLIVAALWPEALTSRGLSYRPEIWSETLRQVREMPFLGHGYDHPLEIHVEGVPYAFSDPHNMILATLYSGGLVGLGLWSWLYGAALRASWRHRRDPLAFVSSATLIYGLAASLTEGGSFLSRPKEHWFLIWIPFALVAAATLSGKDGNAVPARQL